MAEQEPPRQVGVILEEGLVHLRGRALPPEAGRLGAPCESRLHCGFRFK
jgi:hypothetical protein